MRGYRAWDVANKEMLYPDGNGYFGSEHHLSFVIDGNGKPIYIDDMGTPVEIIFLQQIGLNLKDKNGKEIYEGDILKGDGIIGRQQTKEVYFENGSFKVKDYFTKTEIVDSEVLMVGFPDYISMWIFTNKFDIEIIGNIYTTPDLKEQS